MDTVKAHPYYKKIMFICYLLIIIGILLALMLEQSVYLYISLISCIVFGVMYSVYNKRLFNQLRVLIYNCDAIIDGKKLNTIDGEGEISLLSNKLFILNKRYYALIDKMRDEQVELKNYIENISHQLKTPITSMRLNEELLLEVIDNEKQKEKINEIYIQTLKMNQLVNDLLTLALIDSHSVEFKYEDHSLEYMINDIEEDLEYLLREHNMNIRLNKDIHLLCDRKWLIEALKNIIKNCIEKNNDSYIDIYVQELDSLIEITIRDYGKGFLEEDLFHIFERFYRGKNQDYKGVGIGLALSKQIIEEHHGYIKASNNNGAVINIVLPKIFGKKKL